jgi:PAS domain S-box-containing protein
MPKTLRAQLIASVIAVEILAIVWLIFTGTRLIDHTAAALNRQRLEELVPLLTRSLSGPLFEQDVATIERIVSGIMGDEGLTAVSVYDQSGRLLVETRSRPRSQGPVSAAEDEALAATVSLGGRHVGSVRLLVSMAPVEEAKRMVLADGLLIAGLEVIASILALSLIALFLTRDLARMRAVAHKVTQGDWSVRLPVRGSAEVAETAAAINRMLQSLQEAESLVREGEHQYRDLVQQSQQAILVLHGRRPVFANEACARLLGFDAPPAVLALEAIDALIVVGPDAGDRPPGAPADWPESREPFRMQVARPDGARLWLECVGSRVHWRGRPAYQIVMLDITERRRAEEALAESEARFREIVETSLEGMWIIDAESRTTYVNRRMAEMLGYPEGELLGRSYFEFVESGRGEAIQAALERGRQGQARRTEGVLVRRDGQRMVVQASTTPRFDKEGRYLGALGMFTDISQRRQAEDALRDVERRLHTVIQHAPLVLYALDRAGVFVLSEGRELASIGRRPGEVVGQSAFEVFAHLPDRIAHLRRALAGEAFTAEVRVDDQIFAAYHQPLFDAHGAVDGMIVVSVNTTARRRAEEALREAELQLAAVIDHSPVIVFNLDAEGTVALARGKGLEALSVTPQDVAGRSVFEIIGPEGPEADSVRQALGGDAVAVRHHFGGRDLDVRMQPLLDAQGRLERVAGLALDVTERVDAERRLQASEARFRAFAEASGDWLWETDPEHRLTHVSAGYTRISGEPPDFYLGKTREELAADLEQTDKWARYRSLLAANQPVRDFVYLRHTGDGRRGYLRINGVPVFGEDGRFLGYRGTATEITEQMRIQQALAASEGRFRNLVEGSLQGVLVLDVNWRVLFANRAAARMFGFGEPEEMVAQGLVEDFIHPDDRERLRAFNQARMRGERVPNQYEYRGLGKDGSTIWLNALVRVVQWDGTPAAQVTLIDITEQKAVEETSRRNETKFRRLIEGSDLPTFIFDEDWKLVFLNESAARLFAYDSREQALAEIQSGRQLVYDGDIAVLSEYREARREGRPAPPRYEFRAVRRDGKLLWLQNIVSAVEWEGQMASMSVSIDITEHKLRDEVLRQAQKMEVVGQLTGGVAHDFNNLLTVVLGNLELLRRLVGEERRVAELIRSATLAADRGAMLTQRLLAFSRRQALVPESVDVNRLVSGMTDLLRRTLQETIEIETVLAGGLWPALVDPNQLENSLLNLAVNARDAMPDGGKLTIETANTRLDDEYASVHEEVRPGQYVMLAVSDTGAGMSEDVLEHAFEPFFTTKEVGQGSGLGLSMIYGFVKQSQGHVKIYSEPGQGTTVKVYLPRAPMAPGARRPLVAAEAWQGAQQKILVVEDDAAVRELAVAILQNLNYRPLSAADGRSALEILEREPDIALLFTDVVLAGGMGGIDLAREAQRRRPGIKVLYTSGYTENAIIHHGRLDDGVELLEKPFRIDSLARKVRSVLEDA